MKTDETKYQIKDLYDKFGRIEKAMNDGFARIENKLDQALRERDDKEESQSTRISANDKSIGILDTKIGIFAGGQLLVSIIASVIVLILSILWKS